MPGSATPPDETRFSIWERHGQSLLLAVITAALFFASKTLWDANAVQAQLIVRLENLTAQVARLEGAVGSMQQQYVTRPEFAVHEQRIQALEAKRP